MLDEAIKSNSFFQSMIEMISATLTVIVIGMIGLFSLKLLGQYNRKTRGKISESKQSAKRFILKKLSATINHSSDAEDVKQVINDELVSSYLATFQKDVDRGLEIVGESLCKRKRRSRV